MKRTASLFVMMLLFLSGTTAWAKAIFWDSNSPETSVTAGKTYVIKAASKSYNYNGNTDFYFRSYNSTEFNCSYGIMTDGLNSYSWVAEEGSDGTFALKNVHTGTYATSSTSGSFVTGSSTAEYFTLAYDNALSVFTIKSSSNNYLTSGQFSASVTTTAPTTATDAACWTLYEVYDVKPVPANQIVDGQTYVIHNLNQKDRYLAKNDGAENMIASDRYSITDKAFLWTAEKQADGTFALLCHKKNEYLSNTFNSGANTLEVSNTAVGFTISPRVDNNTVFTIKNGTQYVTLGNLSGWGFYQLYFSDAPQSNADLGCWEFYEVINAEQSLAYDNAQAALDLGSGVGYPVEVERTALKNAMNTHVSSSYAADLNTIVATYKTTTNVNLPENGKAYKIKAVYGAGATDYLHKNAEGKLVHAEYGSISDENSMVFICRVTKEGKFVFVNYDGTYLKWVNDAEGNDYLTESYSDINVWTVQYPGNPQAGTNSGEYAAGDFFGRLELYNDSRGYVLLPSKATGDFHHSGQPSRWYGVDVNEHSYTFAFEEVDYANLVNFAETAKIGEDYVATFAAPYPAVVPENVEAYAITGQSGEYAALSEPIASGNAIPAGEGVLLVSKSAMNNVAMVPATTESTANMSGNLLERATGEAIDAATTAYILSAAGGDGVGFYLLGDNRTVGMNKAYLTGLSGGAVLKLNFGGNLTGIDSIENGESTIDNGTVYDLSGRVVNAPVKGGIYIKNGKKYIVK